jgi:predicted phosphate transport protein (TIGR00153 family)
MNIFRRFAFNPFVPLNRLLAKIDGCVRHIEPMMEANFAGKFDVIKDHFREITQAEHEADEIKSGIRDSLRRTIFMPIDRWHFLDIISAADKIADRAEDLGYLLTIRDTHIPPKLQEHFRELTAKTLECYQQLSKTVASFDEVVESGFAGPIADEMTERIDHVSHLEWQTDKIMYKLSQHIFELEDELGPINTLMLQDIGRQLGSFADSCETLAKQIRRTIAR